MGAEWENIVVGISMVFGQSETRPWVVLLLFSQAISGFNPEPSLPSAKLSAGD